MLHSQNATDLIMSFEGLRLKAYQDQNNIWTIGYGHTLGVIPGRVITKYQAINYLNADLYSVDKTLAQFLKVGLTQNQYDALTSFVFNIGSGNFERSSCLRDINQSKFTDACNSIGLWSHVGTVVDAGLVRRRKAEQALFLKT